VVGRIISKKNPLILAGIETTPFRVVAQYPKNCHPGPPPPRKVQIAFILNEAKHQIF